MGDQGIPADSVPAGPGPAAKTRFPVVKVHAINYDESANSNLIQAGSKASDRFTDAGAIEPPYAPDWLCARLENSNCLRQNIDCMATNIDGFGHRFAPIIDLEADDADAKIANAIYLERLDASAAAGTTDTEDDEAISMPTDAEVADRRKQIEAGMRKELARLESFFGFVCVDSSFVGLRKRTREDKELLGFGYWEVIRNAFQKIVELKYVPGQTVRVMPIQGKPVEVKIKVKISDITYAERPKRMSFRTYLQIADGRKVYFKEFGDPRTVSSKTGRVYGGMMPDGSFNDGMADFKAKEWKSSGARDASGSQKLEGPPPATEFIAFNIHTPRGVYGIPRWIGNVLSILGSHDMEEVNLAYWDNKSIPPLVIGVEGGNLGEGAVDKITDILKNEIKGKKNFHKVLVLEATPPVDNSGEIVRDGKVRIWIKPLTEALMKDAIFMEYDRYNRDKVGESFRIPRILRGDTADFNRATAESALIFAEQQVFSPERIDFDEFINRKIMPELNARYYRFESLGPSLRDPEALANMLGSFVSRGILTPGEARADAHEVLGHDVKKVDEPWANGSLPLMLAQAAHAGAPSDPAGDGPPSPADKKTPDKTKPESDAEATAKRVMDEAAHLISLRSAVEKVDAERFKADAAADGDEVVIRVSRELMSRLVIPHKGS